MENLKSIIKEAGKEIKKQEDFSKKYTLKIIPIERKQMSFGKFREKDVLEWCKECGKGSICGRCPSEFNNYNKALREKFQNFERGLFLVIEVPSEEIAGQEALRENRPAKTQRLVNDSLRIIKKKLQETGHNYFYLLGAGPCKLAYCANEECSLLKTNVCKHPDLANDILECSGMNVFQTMKNVGEKIYYIDRNTKPSSIPYGSRVGLILYK